MTSECTSPNKLALADTCTLPAQLAQAPRRVPERRVQRTKVKTRLRAQELTEEQPTRKDCCHGHRHKNGLANSDELLNLQSSFPSAKSLQTTRPATRNPYKQRGQQTPITLPSTFALRGPWMLSCPAQKRPEHERIAPQPWTALNLRHGKGETKASRPQRRLTDEIPSLVNTRACLPTTVPTRETQRLPNETCRFQ